MKQPLHIVILGGGTAGWMAANLFVRQWPAHQVAITLIESADIGIVGVGEGSTPTLKRFFSMIGVSEQQWMARCNATYKLNIRFNGWSPASGIASYSHPFVSQLDSFTQRPFIVNCLTRRLGLNVNTTPEHFFLNGVLAQQGLGPQAPANFPFRQEYGYHFDSHLLGQFLAELATERGVKHQQQNVIDVNRAANGDISSLVTAQGQCISADFFVDCSGFSSRLMQQTLQVPFISYKENLFNDRAVVMPTPISRTIPVETQATALSNGWCWQIPLQNRYGNGYVFSSDFISNDHAETELRSHLGMLDSEQDCRQLKMQVGQLQYHWQHNCVGLGLAQGFIEPLEATALHLVQIGIELFISLFEKGQFSARYRDEYNDKLTERYQRVRDYIVAHYKLNSRNDSEYWRANRNNTVLSESLRQLLDVWQQDGDLTAEIERQNIESHFGTLSWHCLLAGYGVFGPLPANQPGRGDLYKDNDIGAFFAGCALNFRSHADNLAAISSPTS